MSFIGFHFSNAFIRLELSEATRIPLAGLAAGIPRVAPGAEAHQATGRGNRVRRPPRIHPRRRLSLSRLEPVRPPRSAHAQALSGRRGPARLLFARLLEEHGVRFSREV